MVLPCSCRIYEATRSNCASVICTHSFSDEGGVASLPSAWRVLSMPLSTPPRVVAPIVVTDACGAGHPEGRGARAGEQQENVTSGNIETGASSSHYPREEPWTREPSFSYSP